MTDWSYLAYKLKFYWEYLSYRCKFLCLIGLHKKYIKHVLREYPFCTRVKMCSRCNKVIKMLDLSVSPKCHKVLNKKFRFENCKLKENVK